MHISLPTMILALAVVAHKTFGMPTTANDIGNVLTILICNTLKDSQEIDLLLSRACCKKS
jgi:hypothetical protein